MKLDRQTIRRTIGDVSLWSIEQARIEARRLAVMLDTGADPREVERQQQAVQAASKAAAAMQAVTVGEVWKLYLEARKPHWGERHYADHVNLSAAGGGPFKRGAGTTQAGPLAPLMAIPLRDLTAPAVELWAAREAKTRPTSARLAWRCLKAFLSWCAEQPEYAPVLTGGNPAQTKKARESLGRAGVKQDALLSPHWRISMATVRQRLEAMENARRSDLVVVDLTQFYRSVGHVPSYPPVFKLTQAEIERTAQDFRRKHPAVFAEVAP